MNETRPAGRGIITGRSWAVTTTVGYGIGIPASMFLLGGLGRPLSPMLGGMLYVALFGAVLGLCAGVCQVVAIPRRVISTPAMILAGAAGAAAGFAGAAVSGELLGNAIDPMITVVVNGGIIQITSGAMFGLGVGSAQWVVFRRYLRGAGWWVAASMVGAGLGYGAATAILELLDLPLLKAAVGPTFGLTLGLFVGLFQGAALRSDGDRTRQLSPPPTRR